MRTGQIRGVTATLARELCARTYSTKKGSNMRLVAEPKPDMKMRIGKSPDEADAALMLVALCREKFGFGADRKSETKNSPTARNLGGLFSRLNRANLPKTLLR